MKTSILIHVCSGLLSAFALTTRDEFDPQNFASEDIISRDVAVIGGGSSGTYGAINLRELGKSVVVVERQAGLGGHTASYTDPVTGISADYGVQAFWNISVVRDYFAHLNIPITPFTLRPSTTIYADFQTGQRVTVQNPFNYTAYGEQLKKYPYLLYSWDLPSPVPEDLLLPFRDYITKYNLQPDAFTVYSGGQGFANILDQLTVHVFKMVDESYLDSISGNAVVPASHNNGEIYTNALAELGADALLSSTVLAARRPSDSSSGVSLIVKTPSGQKLIQASKLLISIPPLLANMSPFDLDTTESNLFSQWSYSNYFSMLVNDTGFPTGYRFANANASTSTYNIPKLPAPYQITETPIPGYFYVWYGSPYDLTQAEVEADVTAVIKRLRLATNSTASSPPNFVEFRNNTPFKLIVGAEEIKGGFYKDLEGLQGYRNTWYTGAAFLSHDGAILWNFTQSVILPAITA